MSITVIVCAWCDARQTVELTTGGPVIPHDWRLDVDLTPSDEWRRLLCPACAKSPRVTEKGERR